MNTRFYNMTTQQKISDAIKIAEGLLAYNSKMLIEISKKDDFKFNSGKGSEVALALHTERSLVKVFTYKPFYRWSAAIGYFDGESIHVNIRKLPAMDAVDVASNLLHEYSHMAGFSHGNNYPSEYKNNFSVPYFISSNFLKWI